KSGLRCYKKKRRTFASSSDALIHRPPRLTNHRGLSVGIRNDRSRRLIILVARLTRLTIRDHTKNFFILPLLCYNETSYRERISTPGTKRNGTIERQKRTSGQNERLQARACGHSKASRGEHTHRARGERLAADSRRFNSR